MGQNRIQVTLLGDLLYCIVFAKGFLGIHRGSGVQPNREDAGLISFVFF